METDKPEFVPPYGVTWGTFLGVFDKMEKEGIPNRVDRSYLGNQAGTIQTYIIAALRAFGLIAGENAVPTDRLARLVTAPEQERKDGIKALLAAFYPRVYDLGQTQATQGELEELFGTEWGQKGETKIKAIRFYLAAAQYAGVQISPMWKSPRSAPGVRARKAKKASGASTTNANSSATTITTGANLPQAGDEHRVRLPSGATLTLMLSERLLKLPRDERMFVLELIDLLDERNSSASSQPNDDEYEEVDED